MASGTFTDDAGDLRPWAAAALPVVLESVKATPIASKADFVNRVARELRRLEPQDNG